MLTPNDVVTFVEPGDEHVTEVDRPDAVVDFLESDRVWREGVGDEEQALLEPKGPGVGDALDEKVARILDRREPGVVRARRWPVQGRGRPPSQMLMRPLVVVLPSEEIEGPLLGGQRGARWPNGVGLEGLVHPLVGPVLLRVAREDALVLNPEAHPPHIQLRETVNAGRGERDAIVGADRAREAVLAKEPIEDGAHAVAFRGREAAIKNRVC
jgi:hypothetical protein